jgi:hypothetical protein
MAVAAGPVCLYIIVAMEKISRKMDPMLFFGSGGSGGGIRFGDRRAAWCSCDLGSAYVGGAAETIHKHATCIFFGFTARALLNAKCITGISYLT